MTKLFVDEPILIFVDEMKIATIMQAISSTWQKGVFSSTRRWRQRKLSERRKLFRQVRNLPMSVFRKHE